MYNDKARFAVPGPLIIRVGMFIRYRRLYLRTHRGPQG
jgi:hypothetical protein